MSCVPPPTSGFAELVAIEIVIVSVIVCAATMFLKTEFGSVIIACQSVTVNVVPGTGKMEGIRKLLGVAAVWLGKGTCSRVDQ